MFFYLNIKYYICFFIKNNNVRRTVVKVAITKRLLFKNRCLVKAKIEIMLSASIKYSSRMKFKVKGYLLLYFVSYYRC